MTKLSVPEAGFELRGARPTALNVRGFQDATLNGAVPASWDFHAGLSEADRRRLVLESSYELVLIPVDPAGPRRTYDPLASEHSICREFAALATNDDYKAFADRYGVLGIPPDDLSDAGLPGEPLGIWRQCVLDVYRVLRSWDRLQDVALALKRSKVALEKARKAQIERANRGGTTLANADELRGLQDAVTANQKAVQTQVDWFGGTKGIAAKVSSHLRQHVGASLTTDPVQPGTLRFDYVPETLLGVIWLQCAWVLSRRRDYKQCEWCKKWMPTGSAGKPASSRLRIHARVCSNACRAAEYQNRKYSVGRRFTQGETVPAIADSLGRPVPEVDKLLQAYLRMGERRRAKSARRITSPC